MSKFNNLFYRLIEKRDGETDKEAYKRQSAGLEKLKQMSQIKKDMNAAGNTQDARLQALKNLTDLRYNKGNYASQQQAPAQPSSPQPPPTQPPQPPVQPPSSQALPQLPPPSQQPPQQPSPQPKQTAPKTAPAPASTKPVDAAKIAKQYDTMNKIANDPNAPQGEKSAAKKKMSEFESKYQEIISKYKTVPSAPAKPANPPAPAAAPVPKAPAPVSVAPKPAATPVVATPATPQPVAPQPQPVAPVAPQPVPVAPAAPVAPAGGGRVPPPTTPPRTSAPPAGPSNNKPRGIPNPKQPQQQRAPRPYNLSGLQQQWQQMGLGPNAKANALPQGKAAAGVAPQSTTATQTQPNMKQQNFGAYIQPKQQGILSKIAQAPFKALQKGVGAYSKITNAPRALGRSLKAAAQGQPQQLQQQIGSVAGMPANNNKQLEINNLLQRLRTNPNDNQAMSRLKALKAI